MKNAALILILCVLCACSSEQQITPAFATLDKVEQSFEFTYEREDEVTAPTQEFELISPVGGVIRNIADALADLILEEEQDTFDLDPMVFYFPELREFDSAMIRDVRLKRVFIRLKNQNGPTRGSLGFIKRVEVYLVPGFELPPNQNDPLGVQFENDRDYYDDYRLDQDRVISHDIPVDAPMVLSFDRRSSKMACDGRCLDMDIHDVDFKSFFTGGYTSYTIYLRLVIDAIPREKLELESSFELQIDAGLL